MHDLPLVLPPASVDRIATSNVSDYTTLLPTFVRLGPLLKPLPTSRLSHNVLVSGLQRCLHLWRKDHRREKSVCTCHPVRVPS
jgi:hypothetical protein